MRTVKRYICEICHQEYDTSAEALECEARGRPDPIQVGLVFSKTFYDRDLVFAVASWHDYGHRFEVSCWAARDTPYGDNLPPRPGSKDGDRRCGFDVYAGSTTESRVGNPPNRELPAYQRMVEALRAAGIEPTDQTPAPSKKKES